MSPVSSTSLSTKLIRIGVTLLLLALASIGLTLWVTWQLEGGAASVNEAGRMRMQAWRMAGELQAGANADLRAARIAEFDKNLKVLAAGDPSRPLFVPWNPEVHLKFSAVQSLWAVQRTAWLSGDPGGPEAVLKSTADLAASIDALVGAIEQQLSRLTALLNLFQFAMMLLAIFAAVVMLYTGYLYVINPLAQLHRGLLCIERGNFNTRIEVDSKDEFGQVAKGFNGMAARLREMVDGLEAQVRAKTQRVEAQHTRLKTLYEFSEFLAGENSMEDISRGFAQRVRKVMNADAVAVRWLDVATQRYLMLASDCFPQEMVDEERSLPADTCACGSLKHETRTRVIPIRRDAAAPVRHCAKEGYESLVSVPIRLQSRLIGEIDLFFRSPVVLTAEELELLDALASHLASAIEGLRASALEREAAVGEERALLARELHDSIAQSLAFLKIQVQLLRSATHNSQPDQVDAVLDELDAGLRESIGDVRELLVHFRTRTNSEDIEVALQETLQKFRHQTGLAAELVVSGSGLPLPSDVQIQVLHVVQEALSNIRKHSKASSVQLSVDKGRSWSFRVKDDGVGFLPGSSMDSQHVGRHIMQERAHAIGAAIKVESSPGDGTCVSLTLPEHPVTAIPVFAEGSEQN